MQIDPNYLFDVENRVIRLSGEIGEGSFAFISHCLTILEEKNKSKLITLEIKSEGGEMYESLAIVGRMRQSPCKIRTVGYGQIMSAAVAILAAGDERFISKYAWAMHHQAQTELEGSIVDIAQALKQYRREEEAWSDVMEEFTNTPKESWLQAGVSDMYITPSQCLQFGIVDKII